MATTRIPRTLFVFLMLVIALSTVTYAAFALTPGGIGATSGLQEGASILGPGDDCAGDPSHWAFLYDWEYYDYDPSAIGDPNAPSGWRLQYNDVEYWQALASNRVNDVSSALNETACVVYLQAYEFPSYYLVINPGAGYLTMPVVNGDDWNNKVDEIYIVPSGCETQNALPATEENTHYFSMLYQLRDEVFTQNPFGHRLIDIHRHHAREAARILLANPDLRQKLADALQSTAPAVASVIDGDGRFILTGEIISKMETYIIGVAAKASPEMGRAMVSAWRDANLWAYEGMPVGEIWQALGYQQ